PSITVAGGPLTFANTVVGTTSAEQTYTISGSNLSSDLVVTAPTDFQVSSTSGSGFGSSISLTPSSGTVANTTIYIRFAPTSAGAKAGTITHASTIATTQNVAVSGTAVPPTFNVSGRALDDSANALVGIAVALSGSASANTSTDGNGNYSFANLVAGGNYTVTPSSSSYSF